MIPAHRLSRGRSGLRPHSADTLKNLYNERGERRYCTYPFRLHGIASDIVKPCTWLRQISGHSVISVSQLIERGGDLGKVIANTWNSNEFNNVRRAVADGSYFYCDMENCPEYHGEQTFFLTMSELEQQYPKIASFIKGETETYEAGPEMINVAYDPRCNLSCPSCNRLSLPKFSPEITDKFGEGMKLIGRDVCAIYMVGMGDPFGTQHYLKWLQSMDIKDYPKLKEISFNTNAIKLTREVWESIPKEIRDLAITIIVSMDGAQKNSFETNRYPAKWDVFKERMKYVKELRDTNQINHFRIYFVYQSNNFREMPEAIQFAEQHSADSLFFARIRDWNGWDEEKMSAIDVNRLEHPEHQEFLAVSRSLKSKKMGIIVMD